MYKMSNIYELKTEVIKTSTMLNEIESLKAQLRSKESYFTSDSVKPKVLAPGMYAIDFKPIPHPLKNNRSAHLNYIIHLKKSVETVREIVEEARVVKPLDNALNYAFKNYKIDLLTQEYEKFSISNEETIDSGFTRLNAIVTSLKSLDPDYSSKNHVRKFLRALSLKWRAKVTAIEEAKDLATLPLDELIGNLKVYEIVLDNDGVASKTTKEKVKSLALKAKVTREQTSYDSDSQDGSDEDINEEEAEAFNLLARNFCKGNRFGRGNRFGNGGNRFGKGRGHFASECRKPKENKAFMGGAWSDSEDGDENQNDATYLMAIDSQEVVSKPSSSNIDLNIIDLQK
ncbi:hypothetical protein Tco_0237904 [Tanacetum coccineum]